MGDKYNIVFEGQVLPNYDLNIVQKNVVKYLKLPASQVDAFFSGKAIHLKQNLTLDEALKLKEKLSSIGLMVNIVSTSALSLSIEPKQEEVVSSSEVKAKTIEPQSIKPKASAFSEEEYDAYYGSDDDYEPLAPIPSTFEFSSSGRMGRLSFINAQLLLLLAVSPFAILYLVWISFMGFGLLSILIALGGAVVFIIFSYRLIFLRLQDINLSGWFVLIYLLGRVPVIGEIIEFIFTMFLMCYPGTKGENNYGAQPEQGSKIGLVVLIALIFIGAGVEFYLERQYAEKNSEITQSLMLVESLQNNISDYYYEHKKLPSIINDVDGWQEILQVSPIVARIHLESDGLLTVHYRAEIEENGYIMLAPYIDDETVTWRCYASNLSEELIPARCLTQIYSDDAYYGLHDENDYEEYDVSEYFYEY